jgi:hypothetical protein
MNKTKHPDFSGISTEKEKGGAQITLEAVEMLAKLRRMHENEILQFLKKNAASIPLCDENHELYRFKSLFFHRTSGLASENIENIAKNSESESVPAFVDYVKLGDNDYLTITRSKYSDLIPLRECISKIDKETKQKFFDEIKSDMNSGIINTELFANNNIWFLSSNLKHFVIADWLNFASISDFDDKKAALLKLKELLNL